MTRVRPARRQDEAGIALIAVMVLLMILSVAISAMSVSGRTEITISRRHESAALAETAGEAGLNHAIELTLANLNRWEFNGLATTSAAVSNLLLGPDGASGTADADADNGSLEAFGVPRQPARLPLAGTTPTQYDARVFDEDDPLRGVPLDANDIASIGEDAIPTIDNNATIVIQANGYGPDGAITTLEAVASPFTLPAIVSNGDLEIQGNVSIEGTNGSVHANNELELNGSTTISVDATATYGYSESGNPTVGGQTGAGRPQIPIPPISALDYKPQADYILQNDGVMVDQGGATICDASADGNACEDAGYLWKFDGSDGWQLNTNDQAVAGNHHTYYVEGDATISGSPGSNADPLDISIIAEGSISVTGSPVIEANTPALLFVTDLDLKIAGDLQQVGAEARILVHEQLKVTGNASLAGEILIEDASGLGSMVIENSFGGNITITNNETMAARVFGVRGWREVG
jgi:hypothetical protein